MRGEGINHSQALPARKKITVRPADSKTNDKFNQHKTNMMIKLTDTIKQLEERQRRFQSLYYEVKVIARDVLALKRKSDSEFERRGRIESIAFSQERKLIVMLGPGPEEQQEAAEEKIVRDLEKSYRRDLDDVIALLQDHRQQLQYCKMRADDLRFDKKQPSYENNIDQLVQLLTDIESLAAKYVASLGKMNFFSNPTVRKLFSEGRPGVKFEFQHGDRK